MNTSSAGETQPVGATPTQPAQPTSSQTPIVDTNTTVVDGNATSKLNGKEIWNKEAD